MSRAFIIALAAGLFVGVLPSISAEESPPLSAFEFLLGDWQGELLYLDYQDNETWVRLPTWMTCSRSTKGDSLRLEYRYSEPDGSKVDGFEMIRVPDRAESLFYDGLWMIEEVVKSGHDSVERIVLTSEGTDNDLPASIRKTLIHEGDEVRVRKEVRYRGSEEFLLRNEVRLEKR